jgi:hypothetical protein
MTITTLLDAQTFRTFTKFDILSRRKYWKSPVLFAVIMSAAAVVCFLFHSIDGAVLLGSVLLLVGCGMPVLYFITFFRSLSKQVRLQQLDPPRVVYTVQLEKEPEGIKVRNATEQATYSWDKVWHAYRNWGCVYLYVTQDKAFLLPLSGERDGGDALWTLVGEMMGQEKRTDIRKKQAVINARPGTAV